MTDEILLLDRVKRALTAAPGDRNEDDLGMVMTWCKDLSRGEAKKGKVCVLGELEDAVLKALVKDSVLETCGPGRLLIRQGNAGDCMYIVLAGECEVRVTPGGDCPLQEGETLQQLQRGQGVLPKEAGELLGVLVGTVEPGSVIGEVALVKNVVRTANVVVGPGPEPCVLIRISRELFERTLDSQLRRLEQEREDFTSGFHLVSNFNPKLRQQFVRALMKEKYFNGDIIARQSDKVDNVYFIVSGEVILYLNPRKLAAQYELHLQAKNVYSVLPAAPSADAATSYKLVQKASGAGRHKKAPTPGSGGGGGGGSGGGGANGGRIIWSCVSRNGMLGDFEALAQLPSRMSTAVAQTEAVLFRMNMLEFRRLVVREGRETAREARQLAKTALRYRNEKRREKLQAGDSGRLGESEVAFVDYLIRAIDQMALPS